MNKAFQVIALSSLALGQINAAPETKKNPNVMYVNTFEVMRSCEAGQKASKKVEEERQRLSKNLQEEAQSIDKAQKEFNTKAPTLSVESREREERRIKNMQRQFESKVAECEDELKSLMQKTSDEIAKKVEEAVVAEAKERNMDIAVDTMTGRVVYTKAEFDFTDAVTKQINKKDVPAPLATKVTQASVPAKQKPA